MTEGARLASTLGEPAPPFVPTVDASDGPAAGNNAILGLPGQCPLPSPARNASPRTGASRTGEHRSAGPVIGAPPRRRGALRHRSDAQPRIRAQPEGPLTSSRVPSARACANCKALTQIYRPSDIFGARSRLG